MQCVRRFLDLDRPYIYPYTGYDCPSIIIDMQGHNSLFLPPPTLSPSPSLSSFLFMSFRMHNVTLSIFECLCGWHPFLPMHSSHEFCREFNSVELRPVWTTTILGHCRQMKYPTPYLHCKLRPLHWRRKDRIYTPDETLHLLLEMIVFQSTTEL